MRYGVLADIHANLPALRAAVDELRRRGADRWLTLGDVVGYGAQPNECVAEIAALDPIAVAGNHDLIAVGQMSEDRCIPLAQRSLRWTRTVLTPESRSWLAEQPLRTEAPGGVMLAHGSIDDPQEQIVTRGQALRQLRIAEHDGARALLLGHTHRPWVCSSSARLRVGRGRLRLPTEPATLLNPGSVGQSRELRMRARAILLDTDSSTAEFLAIPYDVTAAQSALREAGLPVGSLHLRPSPQATARRALRRALDRRESRVPV
jgi:predicted phosphodiesterase